MSNNSAFQKTLLLQSLSLICTSSKPFEQSTIDEFNAPDQSLAVVLGMSILHLLENKEETIAKVYKMLKPGGIFVSSTACIGGMMFLFKL